MAKLGLSLDLIAMVVGHETGAKQTRRSRPALSNPSSWDFKPTEVRKPQSSTVERLIYSGRNIVAGPRWGRNAGPCLSRSDGPWARPRRLVAEPICSHMPKRTPSLRDASNDRALRARKRRGLATRNPPRQARHSACYRHAHDADHGHHRSRGGPRRDGIDSHWGITPHGARAPFALSINMWPHSWRTRYDNWNRPMVRRP